MSPKQVKRCGFCGEICTTVIWFADIREYGCIVCCPDEAGEA